MLRPKNERRYVIGNGPHCRFRVHVRKPVSFKTRGMCLFVHQALFWPKCLVHENRHNSRFGSHPMPIVAARSDICNMTHLVPAAAGGCYLRSAAPPPAAPYMAAAVCTKACAPLVSGRASAPLHPLDGRETAILPAKRARSAKRRRCGMQFPRRTRTAKPQAEVCGPA